MRFFFITKGMHLTFSFMFIFSFFFWHLFQIGQPKEQTQRQEQTEKEVRLPGTSITPFILSWKKNTVYVWFLSLYFYSITKFCIQWKKLKVHSVQRVRFSTIPLLHTVKQTVNNSLGSQQWRQLESRSASHKFILVFYTHYPGSYSQRMLTNVKATSASYKHYVWLSHNFHTIHCNPCPD